MVFHLYFRDVGLALLLLVVYKIVYSFWIWPNLAYKKLKKNGLNGPSPSFPLGNINDIAVASKKNMIDSSSSSSNGNIISHDIHATIFPHFAQWQKSHGEVFMFWLGTEPFVYVGGAEFLKQMSSSVLGKSWGIPNVFRHDRKPMFGFNGLVMLEGDDWARHRNVLTQAFSPAHLKAKVSQMVTLTDEMLDHWTGIINSGKQEIDVEPDIISTTGEIIAKTNFGMNNENGKKVLHKLRMMQQFLFTTNRYIGVPFGKLLDYKQHIDAKKLGEEIDALFVKIIDDKIKSKEADGWGQEKDLLEIMLADHDFRKTMSTRELVDECKTFFFAGQETTALALIWTLLLLAMHPEWQNQLREEIKQVVGDQVLDANMVAGLKKMGWVWSETLRLYPPGPNTLRQAKDDIRVGEVVIPKGTNIWIGILGMHHDHGLWGDTVNEFRPERFENDIYGGCKHKMGYAPFGFGGRMCIGKNLSSLEYKVVLTLMLSRFSFSVSPYYCHSPAFAFSLRPTKGFPLVVKPIN